MKNLTLLLAALVTAGVYATCSSCTGADVETNPADVGPQAPQQEPNEVTFHVLGMKKTASGAT